MFSNNWFYKLLTKYNAQGERCEFSFIWGKMRTIAWETASQIALRNSSKEVEGAKVSYICDFGEGGVHVIKHTFFCRSLLLVS